MRPIFISKQQIKRKGSAWPGGTLEVVQRDIHYWRWEYHKSTSAQLLQSSSKGSHNDHPVYIVPVVLSIISTCFLAIISKLKHARHLTVNQLFHHFQFGFIHTLWVRFIAFYRHVVLINRVLAACVNNPNLLDFLSTLYSQGLQIKEQYYFVRTKRNLVLCCCFNWKSWRNLQNTL